MRRKFRSSRKPV